jgi:hypothetical protein
VVLLVAFCRIRIGIRAWRLVTSAAFVFKMNEPGTLASPINPVLDSLRQLSQLSP